MQPQQDIMQPQQDVMQPITITTKNKVKDPKKVEQGKKLAELSKKAKEEKNKCQEELEKQNNVTFGYFPAIGIISILGIGIFCYMKSPLKKPIRILSPIKEESEPSNKIRHF